MFLYPGKKMWLMDEDGGEVMHIKIERAVTQHTSDKKDCIVLHITCLEQNAHIRSVSSQIFSDIDDEAAS